MSRIALITGNTVINIIQADMAFAEQLGYSRVIDVTALFEDNDPDNNPSPGWQVDESGEVFTPGVLPSASHAKVMTKRAFIARFPKMPDGISNKYAALNLFLNNDEYAISLVPDLATRINLRLMFNTGSIFLSESLNVNYGMPDAANFTALMSQNLIPASFRLTAAERDAILNTPISAGEQP